MGVAAIIEKKYENNLGGGKDVSPEVQRTPWQKLLSNVIQEEIDPIHV